MKNLKYIIALVSCVNLFTAEFNSNENDNANTSSYGMIKRGPVTSYSRKIHTAQGDYIIYWHNNEKMGEYWKTQKDLASGWRGAKELRLPTSPLQANKEFYDAKMKYEEEKGLLNPDTIKKPNLDEYQKMLDEYNF